MKLVDAFWEKRNIGITATEIVLDTEDDPQHITKVLGSITSEYVVVKIPTCRVDISFTLSELGFTFIETMNHLKHNMDLLPLDKRKQKIYDDTQFLPMNIYDVENMYEHIKDGLFNSDRVYLDPFFTHQQSANRYIGWICDEIKRGSEIYKLVYENNIFGFVGFKKLDGNRYQEYIYGIYPEFQRQGLAFTTTYKLVDLLKGRNVLSIHVDISSNNIASLQSKLRCGYMLNSFTYVFVKHNE
jgi:RimJ/RimL family protein N-acetyltransferase